jgi:hypothetical protein
MIFLLIVGILSSLNLQRIVLVMMSGFQQVDMAIQQFQ